LSADRLEQLNESTLVYHLRKPTPEGHTEIILKPVELLERLSKLITPPNDTSNSFRRTAAHCWALLLVRIYECLPLLCPPCGEAMRIVAFIHEPPVIERILARRRSDGRRHRRLRVMKH
jgi:hypothetical protein